MSSAVVITASYDKQIRFWDAASGRTIRCFGFQDSQVNTLLLLPDMQALAVGGFGVLRVYDIASIISPGSGAGGQSQQPLPQAGGGPAGQGQAPPLLSSFESQGSMNITSLGSFPLRHPAFGKKSGAGAGAGTEASDEDDDSEASSSPGDMGFGATLSMMLLPSVMSAGAHKEVGVMLYATSEDGHIRFFDAKSPTALRMLKDIYTGAAITCSCLSPDRRFLLTGSQIGAVAVWHLPSIIASVSLEMNRVGAKAPQPPADLSAEARAKFDAVVRDAKLFGSKPLQEISFQEDYTAIRSIAMDPLARWAVVATNAGHVHFLRFSHDAHLLGSRSTAAAAVRGSSLGGGRGQTVFGFFRDGGYGAGGGGEAHHTKESGHNDGADSNSLSHGGGGDGGSSVLKLNNGTRSESPSSNTNPNNNNNNGPREGVYRSALVVNELSNQARRTAPAEAGAASVDRAISSDGIGTALLDNLEHQAAVRNSYAEADGASHGVNAGAVANAGGLPQDGSSAAAGAAGVVQTALPTLPPKSALQEELEMECFYSFQAHYKYILKAAISPDGEQLVTCSADYTIGRFIVPQILREAPPSMAAALEKGKKTADEAETTDAKERNAKNHSNTSDPFLCDKTVSPSFAAPATSGAAGDGGHGGDAAARVPPTAGEESGPAAAAAATEEVVATTTAGGVAGDAASAGGGGGGGSGSGDSSPQRRQTTTAPPQHYLFKPLKPLSGHTRWVWDCVFSDCCRFLFSCSSDAQVRMWNGITSDRPQSTSFVGHTKPVVAILLCYDRSSQQ